MIRMGVSGYRPTRVVPDQRPLNGCCMQVCTSLQTDNHASTPPLSFLQTGCPSCHPTSSIKALKAEGYHYYTLSAFSVLTLSVGVRKSIRPVKIE